MTGWRQLEREEWRRRLGGAGVAAELGEPLAAYLTMLARWEGAVDLVGRVDAERLLGEHVLESLAGAALAPERGALLDAGSGNGFPAVPVLLARPHLAGVLLEPRERRWVFLREVVRELGLAAEVRRETIAEHGGGGYDVMTVRALAGAAWRRQAARVLRPGGVLLWWTVAATAARAGVAGLEPVLTSPLPARERGVIAVWRRCFT